jgi:hypothetical protein
MALPHTGPATVRSVLRSGGTAARALPMSEDAPPLTTPRDPAREAAEHELAKRMYHENDPSWLQRTLDAVWEWLDGIFSAASSASPGGALGLVVIVLAVLALLAALWWRLGTPHRMPTSSPTLFGDRARSATEHRTASEGNASRGHWNEAVQERMRAIVRSLEERALLDARPGRTADEAASEASRAFPVHGDRLRSAAHDFDDVTYGGRSADEGTYRRLAALDDDLRRAGPALAGSARTAPGARQGAGE